MTEDVPSRTGMFRVSVKDRRTGELLTHTVSAKDPDGALFKIQEKLTDELEMSCEAYQEKYVAKMVHREGAT